MQLRRFLCCFFINIIFFAQTNADRNDDGKSCVQTPKLNYLSDYTNLLKNVRLCERIAYSKGFTDDDGRIFISYRVPLKTDEDPSELCKCMQTFILQGSWWIGAKHFCYVECDTVTLMLIGTPDKQFITAEPVYTGKQPIDLLIELFGTYSNTQVWNDNCVASPGISQDGRKAIAWTCDYQGSNLPPPDVLCHHIFTYINGGPANDILGKSANHTCTVQGHKFHLDVVANEK